MEAVPEGTTGGWADRIRQHEVFGTGGSSLPVSQSLLHAGW